MAYRILKQDDAKELYTSYIYFDSFKPNGLWVVKDGNSFMSPRYAEFDTLSAAMDVAKELGIS